MSPQRTGKQKSRRGNLGKGLPLRPRMRPVIRSLARWLGTFPDGRAWNMRLRQPPVPLDEHNAALLKRRLDPLLGPLNRHLDAYIQSGRKRARL